MVIIKSLEDFNKFYSVFSKTKNAILIPILSDHNKHPMMNDICLLYIKILDDEYLLPFNHNESPKLSTGYLDLLLKVDTKIWTNDKKTLIHVLPFKYIIDYNLFQFINGHTLEKIPYTISHDFIYRNFYKQDNLNCAVPILKHLEYCRNLLIDIPEFQSSFIKYNSEVLDTLADIESNGIHINWDEFNNHYGKPKLVDKNQLVYSSYNIYTSAGRPSNKFGGINFAAINKTSGIRKTYDSRFENGSLIQLDYDSYHLRLIANILKYDLPTNQSAHYYLGKQYFETDILTPEQLKETKAQNFHILYGGIPDELMTIPFLKQTRDLQDKIFKFAKKYGELFSIRYHKPIHLHKITGINKEKIFNYILQHEETERTISIINVVNRYLKDKNSKIIMYNYDAILIDYCPSDGDIIPDVKRIMDPTGKFPTKVSVGPNYNDLIEIK